MTGRERSRRRLQSLHAGRAGAVRARRDLIARSQFEKDAQPTQEELEAAVQEAEMLLNRAERRALGERGYRFGLGAMATSVKP